MSQKSRWAVLISTSLIAACASGDGAPLRDVTGPAAQVQLSGFAAPSAIVTLASGTIETEVWPYTSTGFSTTPQDPINLVFMGRPTRARSARR